MIFTIGHSTLEPEDYVHVADRMAGVCKADITVIMDVRSHPTSKWPQFRKEALVDWLPAYGLRYVWEPRLGGWTADDLREKAAREFFTGHGVNLRAYAGAKFPKHHIAPTKAPGPGKRPTWTNQGLYDYSWYTGRKAFQEAGHMLIDLARDMNVAIMCAESLWWKCHRSMIADWLCAHGSDAVHLQPKVQAHSSALGNRLERYHPTVRGAWKRGRYLWEAK